jgi:AAA domain
MKGTLYVSKELEQGLLAGLLLGALTLDQVPNEGLSKHGQAVWDTAEYLHAQKVPAPYDQMTVVSAAGDVLGYDKDELRPYVLEVLSRKGQGAAEVLQTLQEQQALQDVVNEAGRQMASKQFDPSAFTEPLGVKRKNKLTPASALIKGDKLPEIPSGLPISLPLMQEASGGLFGFWAIGGKAGVGKSTLGVQLGLEVAEQGVPVIYLDMENGESTLLYRIGQACGGDIKKVKAVTKNLYIRQNAKTLTQDVRSFKTPVLVVIDSLQKLPTKSDQRRTGVDDWLNKLARLRNDGHSILILSEQNGLGGFKETSEVEYTAEFGFQLKENQDGTVDVFVVKNRHRPQKGNICTLERVNDWIFRETDQYQAQANIEEDLGL